MSKHHSNCTCSQCSLCGRTDYDTFSFKQGYVCENCLAFLKEEIPLPDSLEDL